MDLKSGYIERALVGCLTGAYAPWRIRQDYVLDAARTLRPDLSRYLGAIGHRR